MDVTRAETADVGMAVVRSHLRCWIEHSASTYHARSRQAVQSESATTYLLMCDARSEPGERGQGIFGCIRCRLHRNSTWVDGMENGWRGWPSLDDDQVLTPT